MNRAVIAVLVLLCVTGPVQAHGSTPDGHIPWLPPATFALGLLVLGVSVTLDYTGTLEPRYADGGVITGIVGVLVGMGMAFL